MLLDIFYSTFFQSFFFYKFLQIYELLSSFVTQTNKISLNRCFEITLDKNKKCSNKCNNLDIGILGLYIIIYVYAK